MVISRQGSWDSQLRNKLMELKFTLEPWQFSLTTREKAPRSRPLSAARRSYVRHTRLPPSRGGGRCVWYVTYPLQSPMSCWHAGDTLESVQSISDAFPPQSHRNTSLETICPRSRAKISYFIRDIDSPVIIPFSLPLKTVSYKLKLTSPSTQGPRIVWKLGWEWKIQS